MENNNFKKGSEWRKWDLHVHTPLSYLNNQFGNDFDYFVRELFKKAIQKNIAAIGITDYFFIDGYKRIKNEYLEDLNKLKTLFSDEEIEKIRRILVLPNIEFRLNKLVGRKRINFHVIFSNEVTIDDIEENFLREIKFVYEANPQSDDEKRPLTKKNLEELGKKLKEEHSKFSNMSDIEVGAMNAVVDDKDIMGILSNKKSIFKDKYLIFIPADEDLSSISWDGQDHQTRKVLIQKCDGLIASNPNTIKWALGYKHLGSTREEQIKNFKREFKSLKPCIFGSDAHCFEKLFEPSGKKYTWIKADLTFEGLKQIVYEPEERVRIQEKNPQKDYRKPFFSSLTIRKSKIFDEGNVKFLDAEIELNPNLVAIIGGRGTGKSLLLDSIAKTFGKEGANERAKSVCIDNDKFIVSYEKTDGNRLEYKIQEENMLDYLHIHQGEVKNIVDPRVPESLDKEIKRLLNLSEEPTTPYSEEELNRLINEIFEIKEYLEKRDNNGNFINSLTFVKQEIDRREKLISNITTKENTELIEKYSNNLKSIGKIEKLKEKLEFLCEELKSFQEEKNRIINELNKELDPEDKLPLLSFESYLDKISSIVINKEEDLKKLEKENKNIKDEFRSKGIIGDITTLLEQVKNYQNQIIELENRKKAIVEKEKLLERKFKFISDFADKLAESYGDYIENIRKSWNNLKNGKEDWTEEQKNLVKELLKDIEIKVVKRFNSSIFYEELKKCLNLRFFQPTKEQTQEDRIKEVFNVDSENTFVQLLKNEKIISTNNGKLSLSEILNSNLFVKDGAREFLRLLLIKTSKYWNVISEPQYKFKSLSQLSVGMKGTMYICLKLATDPFVKPFIFDQPEDDLDNDFIMNELVPIFRKIKKYRQVIIVTHNANLVVNADAEQIIIAENNDECISYNAGSIENPEIRNKICKILEGGEYAFKQRERKYSF